jgi:dipeptidyl aminopeptidase/acylaminoacyl peptidase
MKAIWVVSLCVLASLAVAKPVSKEVTFKAIDGLVLKGTILLPGAKGKFPAVVMLPGSGPTDRDGNQSIFKTDVLKKIAEELAKSGIATFRFDKRSVGPTYMALYPKDLGKLNDFLSWENHLSDAAKAMNFARSHPQIKADGVAFLGHSEGALYAMQLCAGEKSPVAAVLVSAPGRDLATVTRTQIQASLDRNPGSGVDGPKLLADFDETVKAILETGNVPNVNPLLAPLFPSYASRYLRSLFGFDPAAIAPKMKCPTFVVQAEKDIQVLAKEDAPALLKALRTRAGIASDYLLVKGASHNLKPVKNENTEPGFEGPVVPAALSGIVSWLKGKLGA